MSIFEKIKALWSVNSFVLKGIKGAQMPTVTGKPGWKTTEFWLNLGSQAGVLWGAIQGFIPPKYAAVIVVAGTALYTIARTVAKAVSEIQAAKAISTTVTTTEPVTTVTTPSVSALQ